MKLEKFIKDLENILKENGDELNVVMADNIPVVEPVLSTDRFNNLVVVITDQK